MDTPTLYLFKRAADSQWIFGENSDCECSSGKYRIVPSADRTTVTIYEYGIENYIYYNVPFGNFKNEAGAAYASFAALKAGYAGFFFSVGASSQSFDGSGSLLLPNSSTGLKVRFSQRSGWVYAIDQELTATGFSGIENTDWINVGGISQE